jgi:hypothetical protein
MPDDVSDEQVRNLWYAFRNTHDTASLASLNEVLARFRGYATSQPHRRGYWHAQAVLVQRLIWTQYMRYQ